METPIFMSDLENLRHMLGARKDQKRREWGYRNHFAPSEKDEESMKRLEAAGLVRKGAVFSDAIHFYHATEKGCELLGFSKKQIKLATER